jgi:hypothetical protein
MKDKKYVEKHITNFWNLLDQLTITKTTILDMEKTHYIC